MTATRFKELVTQWNNKTISETDYVELLQFLSLEESEGFRKTLAAETYHQIQEGIAFQQEDADRLFNEIVGKRTGTIHYLRRWVAAAILILAIGAGIYYFNTQSNKSHKSSQITVQTNGRKDDIAPGSNRAILTINNHQNIDLSSQKTGININNTITYSDGEKIADAGQLLQLTTPRGGQYQAVLPDGSKVWLNATSSIKFPSKFSSTERRVEVTGEAYFEIAKDATRPFKVSGGEQEIEVLGTSFNINVYDDEPVKKTTLITGRIKITNNNQTAILKPGQQANIPILSILPIRLILVQTDETIAWTSNLFKFNGTSIREIMRQLSRWYNVEVEYASPVDAHFLATISRNVPLSDVLEMLSLTQSISFRMEGNKIIVDQKRP